MTSKRRTYRRSIVQQREKEVPVRFALGRDGLIALEIAGDHRTQLARLQRLTNEPLDSGS